MREIGYDELREGITNTVARAVWGMLLVWIGAALLLHWSWGVGLLGAGVILLAAQAFRRYVHVKVDGFGLVAGSILVLCGVWNLFDVSVNLVPLLCIGIGIAILVSLWTAKPPHHESGPDELHTPSPPRA